MFSPGDTIGPYRIEREIGRGGMATVYLAYHQRLERPVALKLLKESLQGDTELVDRFLFEARAAARLDHVNIVAIHDAGEVDGRDYIAMEYVEGESLSEILHRVGGPLPLDFALSIVNQVGAALDYAHRRGIVHRDIKPSNILVKDNGHALLTDFGIAHAASMSSLTQAGTILGTPEYMSPEQAEGRLVDGRSDVYALAIVAYHVLSGQSPFRAETPQATLYAHVHQPLPDPRDLNPDLPQGITSVLRTAAAKDPAKRYPTSSAFTRAFGAVAQPQTQPIATPVSSHRSGIWLYVLIGFLLGFAALAIGAWVLLGGELPLVSTSTPPPISTQIVASDVLVTATATLVVLAPPPSSTPTQTATSTPTFTQTPTETPVPTTTPSPTPILPAVPRIAYVSDRSGIAQIYLANSDGTGEIQLTHEGRNEHPFWSRDGDLIFFTSDNGQGPALWSMNPDGSNQTELLFVPGAVAYSISPDGAHTAYALTTEDGYDLFLDGGPWVALSGDQSAYQWAANGSRIVFDNASGPQVIYTIAVGENTAQQLTDSGYSSWNPVWAPDSQQIAFASTRDGNAGIYTLAIADNEVLRLTPLEAWSQAPSWSPDGSSIAHVSGDADSTWSLYLMQADGSGRAQLIRFVFPEAPAVWSGSSDKLAFLLVEGDTELAVIGRDGAGFVQLTSNDAGDWGPVWEP